MPPQAAVDPDADYALAGLYRVFETGAIDDRIGIEITKKIGS